MSKMHPLPWWPRDFAADEMVMLMPLEAEGAYRRLLDHEWLHGSIPNDPKGLALICKGIPVAKMARLWTDYLAACFEPGDEPGRLVNRKLERVRAADLAFREGKARGGRASGEQRRNRKRTEFEQNANTTATEGGTNDEPPSPSPSRTTTTDSPHASSRLINALGRHPDRFGVMALFDQLPPEENPEAWSAILLGCLQGLGLGQGKAATVSQLAAACNEYPAVAKSGWNPRHFKSCVERVMHGSKPRPAPVSKADQAIATAQDWVGKAAS